MKKKPKFELYQSSVNDQYYFRLKSPNGQTILSSEGYVSKRGGLDGCRAVMNTCLEKEEWANRFEIRKSEHNTKRPWYFVVLAGNNEIVGISQMYTRKYGAQKGIRAVHSCVTDPTLFIDEVKDPRIVKSKELDMGYGPSVEIDEVDYGLMPFDNIKVRTKDELLDDVEFVPTVRVGIINRIINFFTQGR